MNGILSVSSFCEVCSLKFENYRNTLALDGKERLPIALRMKETTRSDP